MDNLNMYKIWAPDDALWAQWVKPVLFMKEPYINNLEMNIPDIEWITDYDLNTMIIIDLPAENGVFEGLALAKSGYRPVPLYNGVNGSNEDSMLVDVRNIVKALYKGGDILASCRIHPEAPPVMLLDSNRMEGGIIIPGMYDNRWCVFPQDMPSASFLQKQRIYKIIVRSDIIRNDLAHILRRYQEGGIKIYKCRDGKTVESSPSIVKPSKYKSWSYRFKVMSGLTRNAAGGFGGTIPDPMESGTGGRYYGFG